MHEAELPIAEIERKLGIAEGVCYAWRKEYAGLESEKVCELKQLWEENEKYKRIIVYFPPLDKFILQKLNTRKTHALSLLESASQEVLYRIIIELASTRIRYGYKRIYIMLKREGINVNKKRAHRLYCLEGRQLRPKRPRRKVSGALQIKFRAG
ncbi:IS3 family transposase [Plesiomonas shigelloides]|uniref:IS3 family transposase n=1 Tax=Plesiomonas shigelloides TaxID=703 RepID=UPI00387F27D7